MKKRLLALLLAVVMVTSMFPIPAFAQEEPPAETVTEITAATIPETTAAPETTEAPAPETTEATVPATTEATVPETTEATVPETTEATVPETTEATVPETTEATVPETTEATVPELELFGESNQCGEDLTWSVSGETLTIQGTSGMNDFSADVGAPWDAYANSIYRIYMQGGLNIGQNAFAKLNYATTLRLPSTLESFSLENLSGLNNLAAISFPNGNAHGFSTSAGTDILQTTGDITTLRYVIRSVGAYLVPDTVNAVADNAFASCKYLKTLTFQGSAPSLGEKAFAGLDGVTVYYDGDDSTWNNIDKTAGAYGGTNLTWKTATNACGDYLTWKVEGTTLIIEGEGPMYDYGYDNPAPWSAYTGITTIDMRGGTKIGENAFNCVPFARDSRITTLKLPAALAELSGDSLSSLGWVKTVEFNGENPNFSTTEDKSAVLSKDGKTLVYVAYDLNDYTIPDSVEALQPYSCSDHQRNITFPKTSVYIPKNALRVLSDLTLYFPGKAPTYDTGGSNHTFHGGKATISYSSREDANWLPVAEDLRQSAHDIFMENRYRVSASSVAVGNPTTMKLGTSVDLKAEVWDGDDPVEEAVTWSIGYIRKDGNVVEDPEEIKHYAYFDPENPSRLVTSAEVAGVQVIGLVVSTRDGLAEGCPWIETTYADPAYIDVIYAGTPVTKPGQPGSTVVVDLNKLENGTFTMRTGVWPAGADQTLDWSISTRNWSKLVSFDPDTHTFITTGATGSFSLVLTHPSGMQRTIPVQLVRYSKGVIIQHTMTMEEGKAHIRGGASVTLKAAMEDYKTVTNRTVLWSLDADDAPYATISPKGVLTTYPVAEPTEVKVTAQPYGNYQGRDELTVVIHPAVDDVQLLLGTDEEQTFLTSGGKYTCDVAELADLGLDQIHFHAVCQPYGSLQSGKWTSSNTKVATVDPATGALTVKNAGTAKFTFTAADGTKKNASVTITFTKTPVDIRIDQRGDDTEYQQPLATLKKGESVQLSATVFAGDGTPTTARKLEWELGCDPSIATIRNGKITVKNVPEVMEVGVWVWVPGEENVVSEDYIVLTPATNQLLQIRWAYDPECVYSGYSRQYFGYDSTYGLEVGLYNYESGEFTSLDRDEYTLTSSKPKVGALYWDPWNEGENYYTLRPEAIGTTTVTAKAKVDGKTQTASFIADFQRFPNSVELDVDPDEEIVLRQGQSRTFKATVYRYEGYDGKPLATNQKVTWECLVDFGNPIDPKIASISSSGKLTVKKVTEPTLLVVQARSVWNYDAYAEAFVWLLPKEDYRPAIHFINEGIEATKGDTYYCALNAVNDQMNPFRAGNYFMETIIWENYNDPENFFKQGGEFSSSKPAIADFDENGNLVPKKTGTTVITAKMTMDDGTVVSTSVNLKVIKAVTDITVTPKNAKEQLGDDTYVITSGGSLSFTAKLNQAPGAVKPTNSKVQWCVYEADPCGLTTEYAPTTNATISASGVLKTGKVYNEAVAVAVVARDSDFGTILSEPVFIVIRPKATEIEIYRPEGVLNNRTIFMNAGSMENVGVAVYPYDNVSQDVVWSTSSKGVVSISTRPDSGEVVLTAHKKGTATIKATTTDGSKLTASFTIKVE